jgi:hypothetical protein
MRLLRTFCLRGELTAIVILKPLAHALQESSESLGAPGISRAAQELQELVGSGHWIGARAVFNGLERKIDRPYSGLSALQRAVRS